MAAKAMYDNSEEIEEIELDDTCYSIYTTFRAPPNTPVTAPATTYRIAWDDKKDILEENDQRNLPADSESDISIFSREDNVRTIHHTDVPGIILISDSEVSLNSLNNQRNLLTDSGSDSDISLFSWRDQPRVNRPACVPKLDLRELTSPGRYPATLYIITETGESELNGSVNEINLDDKQPKKVIFQPTLDPTCKEESRDTKKLQKKRKTFTSFRKSLRTVFDFFSKCIRGQN